MWVARGGGGGGGLGVGGVRRWGWGAVCPGCGWGRVASGGGGGGGDRFFRRTSSKLPCHIFFLQKCVCVGGGGVG